MLCVYLFGGFRLAHDDDTALPTIPGARNRSLLAYLCLHRGRPLSRDLLIGTFWPDLPEAVARRRLSQALWRIRQALAPLDCLLTEGDTVQLHPNLPLRLDVEQFTAHHIRCLKDNADTLAHCESCLAYYKGEFMAGYYDDWILVERERLRELFIVTLERLIEGLKAQGEYEMALAHARRLASEDPWREEAHREVMRLCYLLDRHAEALRQFAICRQVLADELDAPPAPETVALATEIATRAGLSQPPLLPAAARPMRSPLLEQPDRLPLVGRQAEMAELLHRVEAAARGRGGLTLIYGEAGVGKTRLVQELARNAEWRGLRVVWGRCYELAAPLAYQPFIEALRAGLDTLRDAPLEPLWQAELSRLLPELGHGQEPPPPLPPQDKGRRLLEALVHGYLALTQAAPCLLILEDVHWMDTASLDALRYLLPRLADMPLAVVVTVRTEDLDGLQAESLAGLENTRLPYRLDLARLDLGGTGELVQQALDLTRPVPRFSARLYAETEGNPFFVVETLRTLVDGGLLERDAKGTWHTPWDETTEDYAELPLPASVAQTIERRLDRLPAALYEKVALAAVIGRDVALELWRQAGGWDEEALLVAGDQLCDRALFYPANPASAPGADYTFAHDQIRRVAYDRLSPPRRRLYHRRVAQALGHLAPDEPAALAYHWSQAEVWDRAADYHRRAGDQARAVHAHAEAVGHYTQALRALERLPGPLDLGQVFELRLAREKALALQGLRPQQAEDLAALEEMLADPTLDRPDRRLRLWLRWLAFHEAIGDYPQALALARETAQLARQAGDADAEWQAHLHWGRMARHQGQWRTAQEHLEQALAMAQKAGDIRARVVTLSELGALHHEQGDLAAAQEYFQQALEHSEHTTDLAAQADLNSSLGNLQHDLAHYDEAIACHRQALALRRKLGDRRGEISSLYNLSTVQHDSGDPSSARQSLEQVCAMARAIGDQRVEGYGYAFLGLALEALGELDAAREAYATALDLRQSAGLPALAVDALAGLARVASAQGHHKQAVAFADEVLTWLKESGIEGVGDPLLAYQGAYRALLAAGQVERGQEALRAAYDLLMSRAEGLAEDELRRAYLYDIEPNRGIMTDYRLLGAQQQEVRLPAADAPVGRPLCDEEYISVAWTVSAPEDEEISSKVKRRRHRLLRLLRQAEEQGASPTVDDLAAALAVSQATLKRDLATLRREGHVIRTRGSRRWIATKGDQTGQDFRNLSSLP